MWVEAHWLPHLGVWTEAVSGAVATGITLIGVMCCVGLCVRGYRLGLQVVAWAFGK